MAEMLGIKESGTVLLRTLGLERNGTSILRPEDVSSKLGLSPRLQVQIRNRIRLVAILALLAFTVSLGFALTAAFSDHPPPFVEFRLTTLILSMALAALVIVVAPRLTAERAVVLALNLQIVLCVMISIVSSLYLLPETLVMLPVTWVTPVIIMFPLLIPTPPRWTLIASSLCALSAPVGTAIAWYLDWRPLDDLPLGMLLALVSPAIAVAIAYFGSSIVYEIGVSAETQRRAGSYVITECLGKGGMGEVYVARHQRLPRPAAVKFIRPEELQARYGSPETAIRRFEREASALTELRSPHTVEIFDFDIDDQGRLFYAMELLEGFDAQNLVGKHGPLPPARVVYLLEQACRSLGEAHEVGLVHRDIKPSNLMICKYGLDYDFVKVLDFGLLTSPRDEPEQPPDADGTPAPADDLEPPLTRRGIVMGTPDFMSPEQVRREPLDGRSDIYALGAVAYFMVTGTYIFRGGDPKEKMIRQRDEAPEPPSNRIDAPLPQKLEALILACLEKDVSDRPQSAAEMAERMRVSVDATWTSEDARRWWEKSRH